MNVLKQKSIRLHFANEAEQFLVRLSPATSEDLVQEAARLNFADRAAFG